MLDTSDPAVVWKKDGWYLFGAPLSGAEGVKSEFSSGYYSLGDLLSSAGIVFLLCSQERCDAGNHGQVGLERGTGPGTWERSHKKERKPQNVVGRDSGADSGTSPHPQEPHQLCGTRGLC